MSFRELFALPEAMPLLLLVPLVWLALIYLDRAAVRRLERGVGPRAHALAPDLALGRRRVKRRLAGLGLLLAMVCVLQPTWGEGTRKVKQRGVDLLVCLDVSQSMLARDPSPSRLERAKLDIRTLAEQVLGDRIGLVVFAGEARLTVPLTQDMDSFTDLVDLAGPLSVRSGGTDLGAALKTALKALEGASGDHEAVLLLTDGEDLKQRGLSMARTCLDENITVHCVGYGSTRGSKIVVEGEGGETFLRDASGNEVVSAMDPVSLRRIAETTGGEFMDAGINQLPLLELYENRILPMARKSFEASGGSERRNRFQWPLLAAFLLWILELCMTDRKAR